MDTSMFDGTEGLPGPVTMNRLGKPAAPGDRVHGQDGAGQRIEAGGEDDGVQIEAVVRGLDAGGRDLADRVFAQVHQRDVGPVVGGVAIGGEAGALGGERVVVGAQRLGGGRIGDDLADLLADELADVGAAPRRAMRP